MRGPLVDLPISSPPSCMPALLFQSLLFPLNDVLGNQHFSFNNDLFKAHVACTIPLTSGGLSSFRIQVFSRAAFLKPDH